MDCEVKTIKVIYTTNIHFFSLISHTHKHAHSTQFLEKKRYLCALSLLSDYTMSYIFISPMLWYICRELNEIVTYLDSDLVITFKYIKI